MTNVKLYDVPVISSVQDMVLRSARVHTDRLALEDLKETPIPRLTYGALLKKILKFGTALSKLGLKPRSHVAIISENRTQWSLAYLTAMCFDYVVVPIDRNLPANEVLNIIHESEAVAIIFSEAFEPTLTESRGSLKNLKYFISMDAPSSRQGIHFDAGDHRRKCGMRRR